MNEHSPLRSDMLNDNRESEPAVTEHVSLNAVAVIRSDFGPFDTPIIGDAAFEHTETPIDATGARPWVIIEPKGQTWREVLDKLDGNKYLVHELSIGVDRELTRGVVSQMQDEIRAVENRYRQTGDSSIYKTNNELIVTSNEHHIPVKMLQDMLEALDLSLDDRDSKSFDRPDDPSWSRSE